MAKDPKKSKNLQDFISPGEERVAYLQIAHLPDRTKVKFPVYIYKAEKPGPSVLFSGGLHGNEINGIEIVRRIREEKINQVDCGMVVCVPVVNVYGFIHFSRYAPDGKDVNRSFPGSGVGSLASRLANAMTKHVLPLIDTGIDFHTGGDQRYNAPQIRGDFSKEGVLELAQSTQSPFIIHSSMIPKSFRRTAHRKGKNILVFEGGESDRIHAPIIESGVECATRFLENLGMREKSLPEKESTFIKESRWYRCPDAGMWIPNVSSGDFVEKDSILGYMKSPYGDLSTKVKAKTSGYVIGINHQSVLNRGDALLHLGVI